MKPAELLKFTINNPTAQLWDQYSRYYETAENVQKILIAEIQVISGYPEEFADRWIIKPEE